MVDDRAVPKEARYVIEEQFYNRWFDIETRILYEGANISQMRTLWRNVVPMRITKDTVGINLYDRVKGVLLEQTK